MSLSSSQKRAVEALVALALLFAPLVLATFPLFARNQFPGPFTRVDAIWIFFTAVPVLFVILATFRVAQYHGVIGVEEDQL